MRSTIASLLFSLAILGLATPTSLVVAQGALVGEGERPGTKITIRDVKRDDGGTVTLRFQLANENDAKASIYAIIGGYLDGRVHLIDAANKKKYLVVKDSAGKCECTHISGEVSKGSVVNLWAKFPAPPESVKRITVVVGGFEPVESVPITSR